MLMECGLNRNREKSLKISQIPKKKKKKKEALYLTLELVDKSLIRFLFFLTLFKEDSLFLIVKIC